MIDLSELEGAEDGCIRVGAASAATMWRVSIEPDISRASVNPKGETSALGQSFVIVLPVADAVLALSFFGHASNLADVSPP